MITPVPEGVNPNTHVCGCGGRLRMPWVEVLQDHALVCVEDNSHPTYKKKNTGTRIISGVEYNIMTQQPTTELANIKDKDTALAHVSKAKGLGLFPGKQTQEQLDLLAEVALHYRLDPLLGEIMPYQGKPYITIKGRRRLDADAGNKMGISFRPPTDAEEAYYIKVGAMDKMDVIQIAVGIHPGGTSEGFGRMLWSEDVATVGEARNHLPVVMRKIEMAQKRGEMRLREIVFGPVAKPVGFQAPVLQEGDEIVEGAARIVEDTPSTLPDLGDCMIHHTPWTVEKRFNKVVASHSPPAEGEPWCQLDKIYGEALRTAWDQTHPTYVKAEVDTWLKDHFNGRTWSKMDAPEHIRAVTLLLPAPSPREPVTGGPEGTEMWESSDELAAPGKQAEDATERNRQLDNEIVEEQGVEY